MTLLQKEKIIITIGGTKMMKTKLAKTANLALLASSLLLAACNGGSTGGGGHTGGGTGGGGTSTYGLYTSSAISVDSFVNALNNVDVTADYYSEVMLYADETYRYLDEGLDDWFVIYDGKYDENKAVSLQYIRTIQYYDYMSNNNSLAAEFRAIETDDILSGNLNGDYYGDDYEVVDYDPITDSYWGRNSGYEYEDEAETTDVRLMAAKKSELQFIKKASAVSFEFSVGMPTAMTLVSLGQKLESMSKNGELSSEDFAVLANDMEKIAGANLSDLAKAATDADVKEEVLQKVADKVGTTAANVEQKLLPELFGINL